MTLRRGVVTESFSGGRFCAAPVLTHLHAPPFFSLLPSFVINLVFPLSDGLLLGVRFLEDGSALPHLISQTLHCLLPRSHTLAFSLVEVMEISLW